MDKAGTKHLSFSGRITGWVILPLAALLFHVLLFSLLFHLTIFALTRVRQ